MPEVFDDVAELPFGIVLPFYRIFVLVVGALAAIALYWIIHRTRLGMLSRAAASDRDTVAALGGNVTRLYGAVFAAGASLAGLAGALVAPLTSIEFRDGRPPADYGICGGRDWWSWVREGCFHRCADYRNC